jgi:hypothetical protein
VQLHLGVDEDFHPARKTHPAFIADSLDGLISKILFEGFEIDTRQPPLDRYTNALMFLTHLETGLN